MLPKPPPPPIKDLSQTRDGSRRMDKAAIAEAEATAAVLQVTTGGGVDFRKGGDGGPLLARVSTIAGTWTRGCDDGDGSMTKGLGATLMNPWDIDMGILRYVQARTPGVVVPRLPNPRSSHLQGGLAEVQRPRCPSDCPVRSTR